MAKRRKIGGSTKDRNVKRKPANNKQPKKATLPQRFAARLRELMGDRPASFLAEPCGVSNDAVLKWLRGDTTPGVERWEKIADVLGLESYRDLVP